MAELKLYSNEKLIILPYPKTNRGFKYALTNYGRVISYQTTPEEGSFLKHGYTRGYPVISIRKRDQQQTFLIHRLVAQYFLTRPSTKHKYVLHLNFKKEDNYAHNLKWATPEENRAHSQKKRRLTEKGNYKLSAERVKLIKKKMLNGKNRLKSIAKQFGVSDMQIHRIKTGENWGYVKI